MPTVHAENGGWSTCCSRRSPTWASPALRATHVAPAGGRARPPTRAIAIADVNWACRTHVVQTSCIGMAEPSPRPRAWPARLRRRCSRATLVIDDSVYRHPDFANAAWPCDEPHFRPKGNREFLWRGLQSGSLHTTATDHCTFCAAQKARPGRLAKIPTAAAASRTDGRDLGWRRQHRPPDAQRSSWPSPSANTAKLFNLYPQKGWWRKGRCRPGGLGPAGTNFCRPPRTARATSTCSGHDRARHPSHTMSQGRWWCYAKGDCGYPAGGRYIKRPALARTSPPAKRPGNPSPTVGGALSPSLPPETL